MHGDVSTPSCCAFIHRFAFEEVPGHRVLIKSAPGNREHLKQRTENELTQQELNVLNLHKQGFSYRNIAERIGISKSTVSNIVKKHLSKTVQASNDDGHVDTDGQLDIDWIEDENTDEEL